MSKITQNIFPLEWYLKDLPYVESNNKKVFGTFICGGGSSMGYKMAGYTHLGGVEFLEKYANCYKANLNPKYLYVEDIRNFVQRNDLPEELYQLDLLDGSPPCAAFSTAGLREKGLGIQKQYEEIKQRRDDLVFIYGDTILKLRPKVFLLENVSGLVKGYGKIYVRDFIAKVKPFYKCQVFLLSAASMSIPQDRQRTFIIGLRNDFELPPLSLDFDCPVTTFAITEKYWEIDTGEDLNIDRFAIGKYWEETNIGESHEKRFSLIRPAINKPCPTILQSASVISLAGICHPLYKRKLNREECRLLCTFPLDYKFEGVLPLNIMGRSVLPVMMANISYQIYEQWLSKI